MDCETANQTMGLSRRLGEALRLQRQDETAETIARAVANELGVPARGWTLIARLEEPVRKTLDACRKRGLWDPELGLGIITPRKRR